MLPVIPLCKHVAMTMQSKKKSALFSWISAIQSQMVARLFREHEGTCSSNSKGSVCTMKWHLSVKLQISTPRLPHENLWWHAEALNYRLTFVKMWLLNLLTHRMVGSNHLFTMKVRNTWSLLRNYLVMGLALTEQIMSQTVTGLAEGDVNNNNGVGM